MTESTVLTEKDEKKTLSQTNETNNGSIENNSSSTETKTQTSETIVNEKDNEPKIELKNMTLDHILDVMSIPTYSKEEVRMVSFIILWARRNNVEYEFDAYGNVYLTKGKLNDGESYPCVTSHMDTVHKEHTPYIYANAPLPLKIESIVKDKKTVHKLSVKSKSTPIGIGADDKGGICIALGMFQHLDKLKACFFLDEETGCHGSDNLDKDWFNNVGYVIGLDSPEKERAAWKCSGQKLFSYDFYEKYMKDVCAKHGLVNCFYSEPYTDVKNIRIKTDIICMNFGNGGYNPHANSEYCIIEEMDDVCEMCVELVNKIGNTRHLLSNDTPKEKSEIKKNTDGTYDVTVTNLDDTEKLEALGDNNRRKSYASYYSGNYSSSTSYSSSSTKPKKEDVIKHEVVQYIVRRYESQISGIKDDLKDSMKKLCEKLNVNYNDFENVINDCFNNEIKF